MRQPNDSSAEIRLLLVQAVPNGQNTADALAQANRSWTVHWAPDLRGAKAAVGVQSVDAVLIARELLDQPGLRAFRRAQGFATPLRLIAFGPDETRQSILELRGFGVDQFVAVGAGGIRLLSLAVRDVLAGGAPRALTPAAEGYFRLLEIVDNPIWVIGEDWRFRFANPAALQLMGEKTMDEIAGESVGTVISPQQVADLQRLASASRRSNDRRASIRWPDSLHPDRTLQVTAWLRDDGALELTAFDITEVGIGDPTWILGPVDPSHGTPTDTQSA